MKINNLQLGTRAARTASGRPMTRHIRLRSPSTAAVAEEATVISALFDECESAGLASSHAGSSARHPES